MLIFIYIILFLFIIVLFTSWFIVKQQTAVVVERMGKFHSVRSAGLNFKIPIADTKSRPINLRIQQLDVVVETKTKDDVFVHLKVSTQFQIPKERVKDAFYKLDWDEIAYIGDDINDIKLLQKVGLSATPAQAPHYIKKIVDVVLRKEGGKGAFREFVEHYLDDRNLLNDAIEKYLLVLEK